MTYEVALQRYPNVETVEPEIWQLMKLPVGLFELVPCDLLEASHVQIEPREIKGCENWQWC